MQRNNNLTALEDLGAVCLRSRCCCQLNLREETVKMNGLGATWCLRTCICFDSGDWNVVFRLINGSVSPKRMSGHTTRSPESAFSISDATGVVHEVVRASFWEWLRRHFKNRSSCSVDCFRIQHPQWQLHMSYWNAISIGEISSTE